MLRRSLYLTRPFRPSPATAAPRPRSIMTEAIFRYIDPATYDLSAGGKPWTKVDSDVTSFSRTSIIRPVQNIRGREAEFSSVDTAGFAVYNHPAKEKTFTDEEAIRAGYYDEVEALLREKLGPKVKKVVIFDHTIRRRVKDAPRQPVQQVHVDQTPRAAEVRVRRHVEDPKEVEDLLSRRYQLINVWRPIENPATDFPLAVIDWRTTSPEDLVKVDLLYPVRQDDKDNDDRGKEVFPDPKSATSTEGYEVKGETYSVAPNEKHQLYYYKGMTPEEVMFIKCFDSHSQGFSNGKQGVAALTPHTAFEDPQTPKDAPGRQSIEVRCLVFYDD